MNIDQSDRVAGWIAGRPPWFRRLDHILFETWASWVIIGLAIMIGAFEVWWLR